MINLKGLRLLLFEYTRNKNITIKRKTKPKLVETPKGPEYKRISYIEIEIIE